MYSDGPHPILAITVIAAAFAIIWYMRTNNLFKNIKIRIEEAGSELTIDLKKKVDALKNITRFLNNHFSLEKINIENINVQDDTDILEETEINKQLDNYIRKIDELISNNDKVRKNAEFRELYKELMLSDDNLNTARRIYNANISYFNEKRVSFPSNIVASQKGYNKEQYFGIIKEEIEEVSADELKKGF